MKQAIGLNMVGGLKEFLAVFHCRLRVGEAVVLRALHLPLPERYRPHIMGRTRHGVAKQVSL
jgi:hypothetical protein